MVARQLRRHAVLALAVDADAEAVLTILEARTAGNGGRRRATSTRQRSGQETTLTPVRVIVEVIGCAERRRCAGRCTRCMNRRCMNRR